MSEPVAEVPKHTPFHVVAKEAADIHKFFENPEKYTKSSPSFSPKREPQLSLGTIGFTQEDPLFQLRTNISYKRDKEGRGDKQFFMQTSMWKPKDRTLDVDAFRKRLEEVKKPDDSGYVTSVDKDGNVQINSSDVLRSYEVFTVHDGLLATALETKNLPQDSRFDMLYENYAQVLEEVIKVYFGTHPIPPGDYSLKPAIDLRSV